MAEQLISELTIPDVIGIFIGLVALCASMVRLKLTSNAVKAAARSAAASEETAAVAKKNIELSHAAFRVDQRAWISREVEVRRRSNHQVPSLFVTKLENVGRTPALETRSWQGTYIGTGFPDTVPEPKFESRAPVAAGGTLAITTGVPDDSDPGLQKVRDGQLQLFLFGVTKYRDVFREEHETTWCLLYYPATQLMSYYHEHNEMT